MDFGANKRQLGLILLTWSLFMITKKPISTSKSIGYIPYFLYIEHNHRVADQIEE